MKGWKIERPCRPYSIEANITAGTGGGFAGCRGTAASLSTSGLTGNFRSRSLPSCCEGIVERLLVSGLNILVLWEKFPLWRNVVQRFPNLDSWRPLTSQLRRISFLVDRRDQAARRGHSAGGHGHAAGRRDVGQRVRREEPRRRVLAQRLLQEPRLRRGRGTDPQERGL